MCGSRDVALIILTSAPHGDELSASSPYKINAGGNPIVPFT